MRTRKMLRRKGIKRPFQGNDRIKDYLQWKREKKASNAGRVAPGERTPTPEERPPDGG